MEIILSILSAVSAFVEAHLQIVAILLAMMNVYAFVLYGLDKRYAKKKKWRISEASLIWAAVLYGALGAYLGMKLFRHKTKHLKFTFTVPFLLILQIAFAVVLGIV